MILKVIKSILFLSVPERYKDEFRYEINRINIGRAKATGIAFIVFEIILLIVLLLAKSNNFLKSPDFNYIVMYVLMIIAMVVHLFIFINVERDIPKNKKVILIAGITFTCFILLWCAEISLLDQTKYSQIIVYVIAMLCVAVTPYYKPSILLFIYLLPHAVFTAFLPHFQESSKILYSHYVNSTFFLVTSWVISWMRYKNKIEEFCNIKVIQEKNDELKIVNNQLEEANKKLQRLSHTDSLTGVYNRRMFDKMLRLEWDRCKRHRIPLSLIMIDIDFFKAFNDNYGHQAGDDCIRKVAGVISAYVQRSSDIMARYGGEEFVIILPHMDRNKAAMFAEKLRKGVEELNIPHDYSCAAEHITICLGVNTVIPSPKLTIERFVECADRALYEAKSKNRNKVIVSEA